MEIKTFEQMRAVLKEHLADSQTQRMLSVLSSAKNPRGDREGAKTNQDHRTVGCILRNIF